MLYAAGLRTAPGYKQPGAVFLGMPVQSSVNCTKVRFDAAKSRIPGAFRYGKKMIRGKPPVSKGSFPRSESLYRACAVLKQHSGLSL